METENIVISNKIDNRVKNKIIKILLFYKFEEIKNPEYFARRHLNFCKKLGVLGKVLVSKEGINGSISGTREQIEKYKQFLLSLKGFENIKFKKESSFEHPFRKINVRVRNEIISLRKPVNMNNKGKYIKPKEFLDLYKNENLKDVIILDTRNYYECELGRFKNAVNPNIKTFRELPNFVENFKKDIDKNKKIITYCTGGIRCEKASAYLKEQGFDNVYQLEGGIINFCQQFPNTVWEGKCFVFDKRLVSDINQNNMPITRCIDCGELCDLYKNCKNLNCDKLVIICVNCQEKLQGCCSKGCLSEFNNYARKRAELKKLGKWKQKDILQNYAKEM